MNNDEKKSGVCTVAKAQVYKHDSSYTNASVEIKK